MKVLAPGKLILSGEHAVIYGKPALAFAIDMYAQTTISHHHRNGIKLALTDIEETQVFSSAEIFQLALSIQDKYNRFKKGEIAIREVLSYPHSLSSFTLALILNSLKIDFTPDIKIDITSSLPIGAGVGSSAAIILSIIHAITHYFKKSLTQDELFQLALTAENMQHGVSSGLDLKLSLHGGCFYYKKGEVTTRPPPNFPMYMVDTGIPDSTTGECVAAGAQHFKNDRLATDFEVLTEALDQSLLKNHGISEIKKLIQINHELLKMIGVVPYKVQQFIKAVESLEGAAKICGAGAISGDGAGTVLLIGEDENAFNQLCHRYGYSIKPVKVAVRGVHVI